MQGKLFCHRTRQCMLGRRISDSSPRCTIRSPHFSSRRLNRWWACQVVPKTCLLTDKRKEQWWAERSLWVFKPAAMHGSRGALRAHTVLAVPVSLFHEGCLERCSSDYGTCCVTGVVMGTEMEKMGQLRAMGKDTIVQRLLKVIRAFD
jgi:hypothetical protein